jgi:hypothetical protein
LGVSMGEEPLPRASVLFEVLNGNLNRCNDW